MFYELIRTHYCKMAAPSDPILNVSAGYKSRKSTLYRQSIILLFLIIANSFVLLISDAFNLIKSSVYSLKSLSFVYICVQLILSYFGVGLRDNEAEFSYKVSLNCFIFAVLCHSKGRAAPPCHKVDHDLTMFFFFFCKYYYYIYLKQGFF